MNNLTQAPGFFVKVLQIEIEQSQRLLDLLRKEYQLLQKGSPQDLQALTEEKKQQIKHVESAVLNHNRFLEQQGLSADRQGTEAYINQCEEHERLGEIWQQFITLMEACQKQNEINGGAVQLNRRQVTQTLDILKGISQKDKTYGPTGESKSNATSKSLGKA